MRCQNRLFDVFTTAYIECALWLCADEDDHSPVTHDVTVDQIIQPTLDEIVEDCAAFQKAHMHQIRHNLSQAGHDFFLTRNRHGSGFWDRTDIWKNGNPRKLTDSAHVFGTFQLVESWTDGSIYHHN